MERVKETWRQVDNDKWSIAVLDFETDPFEYDKKPDPFACGLYTGASFLYFWGDDCAQQAMDHVATLPGKFVIYAHNGGKFDFYFLLKWIKGKVRIVNGRILQCQIGKHELRDSWAILPFPLREYEKDKIDYEKFKRDKRDANREEIIAYLKGDCVYLYDLVWQFMVRFGESLTIGAMSMRKLSERHPFERLKQEQDEFLRPFNFGGRTQCFKTGIIRGDYKVYDVNAMYPFVMANVKHPISNQYHVGDKITADTCFVRFIGKNDGAIPFRGENGLDFTKEYGDFHATIHEIEAAQDLGLLRIDKIIYTVDFYERSDFKEYIDEFHALRREAQATDDKAGNLLYKFLLNSSYGKFSQNPENHWEYEISEHELEPPWELAETHGPYLLYKKPPKVKRYFNVATGASITGAARSLLLRGIAGATVPLYCDTDSLICADLDAVIDARRLGAWKLEASGNCVAIAGKKMYAVFAVDQYAADYAMSVKKKLAEIPLVPRYGYCIKQASKGVRLTPKQIVQVATGETVEHFNPVPKFRRDGGATFLKRRIKMTA